jgi:hypothetical protein
MREIPNPTRPRRRTPAAALVLGGLVLIGVLIEVGRALLGT